jgi:ribosome-binding factor A
MGLKDERATSIIHHSVGAFLATIAEPGSLVTVTNIEAKDKERLVHIFVTIYPESKEEEVMKHLKRQRSNLREYVKEHERLLNIPVFDFRIDKGEKNRQHIEEISAKL